MGKAINRREFNKHIFKTGMALGLTSIKPTMKILGANDRINIGVIGTANRGSQMIEAFKEHSDCDIIALCDVHKGSLAKGAKVLGKSVSHYKDFRKMLEWKEIDAVVIVTPDHWHAIQFILSAETGKDIYVEKPLSITIYEGRKMVEAAERYKIVSQVGSHRRSTTLYNRAVDLVHKGKIGKPTSARYYRISNMYPNGIGNPPDTAPPKDLDWDMWLGPRPNIPYNENKCLYKFRWFFDYSSQTGNWGAHYNDLALWFLNEKGPVRVAAFGGNYAVKDNRDIPDTMQVMYEYGCGAVSSFGIYEASSGPGLPEGAEFELRGTDGTLYSSGDWVKIKPADLGQFQTREIPIKETYFTGTEKSHHKQTTKHVRNFLDCIKSRKKCNADIEIGHRSNTMCLLANIAYKTKSLIEWDLKEERITNNHTLNQYLHYEYRAPWKL